MDNRIQELQETYQYPTSDRLGRAQYLVSQVETGYLTMRVAAKEIEDNEYWRELGYDSCVTCIMAVLHKSRSAAYALLAPPDREPIPQLHPRTTVHNSRGRTMTPDTVSTPVTPSRPVVSPVVAAVPVVQARAPEPTAGDLIIPSTPFAGFHSEKIVRDGRGFSLIVEARVDGAMKVTPPSWHPTFEDAVRALLGRWS